MGHNTRVLGGSGDQGVDLIVDYFGERVAVQCKNYAKPVGNKPVQEVYTGAKHHRCQQAWVVAPAGFTNGAYELARSVGVKLFASASIRAWVGEVDEAASPHPRSEMFPPTSGQRKQDNEREQRKQDNERYHAVLDLYELELTRLERAHNRRLTASVLQTLFDTQARIHHVRKELDAFEKLGTESLEQKQRHAQLKARHEQIQEKIQEKAGQEVRKRHRRGWRGGRWRASEDPLWVWGCGGPTIGCLVVLLVFTITSFTSVFLGGSLVDGVMASFVVLGGIVGLLYAAAKYYS
jgi:hypothetical protein